MLWIEQLCVIENNTVHIQNKGDLLLKFLIIIILYSNQKINSNTCVLEFLLLQQNTWPTKQVGEERV